MDKNREIHPGEKISALGYTFTVGEILFQDYYGPRVDAGASDCWGYDVEFKDINGRYHHWKQNQDHGYLWKKHENGINEIINDEGSLEPGSACLRIHFVDPKDPGVQSVGALVYYVGRDAEMNYIFRSATYGHDFLLDKHLRTITCSRHPSEHMPVDNKTGWLRLVP